MINIWEHTWYCLSIIKIQATQVSLLQTTIWCAMSIFMIHKNTVKKLFIYTKMTLFDRINKSITYLDFQKNIVRPHKQWEIRTILNSRWQPSESHFQFTPLQLSYNTTYIAIHGAFTIDLFKLKLWSFFGWKTHTSIKEHMET